MNTRPSLGVANVRRSMTWLAAAGLAFACVARAQTSDERFGIREQRPATGSHILRDVAWSRTIPLNRRYDELTPEQKASLHAAYEHIEPGDEPPFPKDGLAPIVEALTKAQAKLLVKGSLRLIVHVEASGEASSVTAIGSPGAQMTKAAAAILMLTKYKPAMCSGQACAMDYPFEMGFAVR